VSKKNFYAVKKGFTSMVIVETWEECSALVTGCPHARFKGFHTEQDAQDFLNWVEPKKKISQMNAKPPPKQEAGFDPIKYPCIKRKSYLCPVKHIYFKNRCVMRQGPTVTGENYVLSTDTSIPWEVSGE
jgi:hypothetical protein